MLGLGSASQNLYNSVKQVTYAAMPRCARLESGANSTYLVGGCEKSNKKMYLK